MRNPLSPLVVAAAAAMATLALGLTFDHLQNEAHLQRERSALTERATILRSRLEHSVAQHLGALETTEALVLANQGMEERVFQAIGPALQQGLPAIKEVQLAPGGVIQSVYPADRAEAVRGLDLLSLPAQRDVVRQTIEDGKARLGGPMALHQGGIGIVARNPVFLDEKGKRQFWGFVSLVIDLSTFLSSVPGLTNSPGLVVAIRGKDGLGERGEVFFGDPSDFAGDAVMATVTLPQGSWQLALHPSRGWARYRPASPWFRALLAVLTVVIGGLSYHVRARGIEIQRMATIDTLTGILMRGAFLKVAEVEVARVLRHGRPLCALLIDVDHFKRVNDSHGHPAGDKVLHAVAQRAAQSLRPGDALGRMGGEEFAVIAPDTDLRQAQALAERLRAGIEHMRIDTKAGELSVTISCGIAQLSPDRGDLHRLLAEADAMLYEAKRSGRNRVASA